MTPPRLVAIVIALTAIWGSQYLVVQRALADLPPLWLGFLRFAVVAAVAQIAVWVVRAPPAGQLPVRALYGLSHALSIGLLYWAQTRVPSGTAALMVATTPILVAWVAPRLVPGEVGSRRVVAGCVLGTAGVALLTGRQLEGGFGLGVAAIVASNLASVATRITAARLVARMEPVVLLRDLGVGVAATLGLAAALSERFDPARVPTATWIAVGYLGLVGSALATGLYLVAQRHVSTARLGFQQYGSAVLAAGLGMALGGEPAGFPQWAGIALVVAGGALVVARPAADRGAHAQPGQMGA